MKVLTDAVELPAEPRTVVFLSLPDGVGGSTRSLANLLGYLSGEATRVLAAPPAGRFVNLVADRGAAEWHLPVVDWGEGRALVRRARTAMRLLRALRPHRREVLAIHANGFNELAAALPAALAWRLPIVVWVHNIEAGRAVDLMRRIWGPVSRRTDIRWAAVSGFARDLTAGAGLARAEDVVVVPNPIDAADVVAGAGQPARERPPGEPVSVAYLGAPRDYKGFHFLPELVERVGARAPVRWLIFSRQTDDHLPDVWNTLRQLEASGPVSIEGKLTDVSQAYAQCDIVVVPSERESFCRVAAEAMLNGIPVVGSDLQPIRALLGDGDAGLLFRVGDMEAAAAAIVRLAGDPKLRERLGAEGRTRAAAFGPEPIRREFLDLLGLGTGESVPRRPASGVPAAGGGE
jgi:glycosyltransferase involved in cell wall biosynthesis